MGDDNGHRRAAIGGQCAAAVEAEPADPEQAGADHRQTGAMRRVQGIGKAAPAADHHRDDQGRDPGRGVHHQAAGEIHHPHLGQPAAAPNPMADRRVNQQQPGAGEQDHGRKFDPLGIGPDDQRRGDHGEGHLEGKKGAFRQTAGHRVGADAGQEHFVQAAPQRSPRRRRRRRWRSRRPATTPSRGPRSRSNASAPTAGCGPAPGRHRTAPNQARSSSRPGRWRSKSTPCRHGRAHCRPWHEASRGHRGKRQLAPQNHVYPPRLRPYRRRPFGALAAMSLPGLSLQTPAPKGKPAAAPPAGDQSLSPAPIRLWWRSRVLHMETL